MKQIAEVTQEAIIILISNPVDSMVYFANQVNYPTHKIIGTGTALEAQGSKPLSLSITKLILKMLKLLLLVNMVSMQCLYGAKCAFMVWNYQSMKL